LRQISYRFLTPGSTSFLLSIEDSTKDTATLQECKTADNRVYWIGPAEIA
jgi:hypothetical protein